LQGIREKLNNEYEKSLNPFNLEIRAAYREDQERKNRGEKSSTTVPLRFKYPENLDL
jgi:hypothetical protein